MSNAHNLFDTLKQFDLGTGREGNYYSLPALEKAGVGPISKLPISIRIVLESVLRHCDGNQSRAAEWLGINRNTLRRKLLDHKLIK